MLVQSTLETKTKVGTTSQSHAISTLIPGFLAYGQYELRWAEQTVKKYQESLDWVVRDIGDLAAEELGQTHVTELKQKMFNRGAKEARVASIVFALKGLLKYCRQALELDVLDDQKIKSPRLRRKEVIFLTPEEIEKFISVIKVETVWKSKNKNHVCLDGLRFRTLVEVLLGTAMRISEALSLNRDSIDFQSGEAKIIGKGSKERTVFFSERSLYWVRYYLEQRKDNELPLFVTQQLRRPSKDDINSLFRRYARKAGLSKKVSPHILRHTSATTLLFNGCPIAHVKEILGHDRLETTCKYYLGVDKRLAKEAHGKFLSF